MRREWLMLILIVPLIMEAHACSGSYSSESRLSWLLWMLCTVGVRLSVLEGADFVLSYSSPLATTITCYVLASVGIQLYSLVRTDNTAGTSLERASLFIFLRA